MSDNLLSGFLLSVAGNPRILPSHISLFIAILYVTGFKNKSLNTNRRELMKLSKLKSTATYHKCNKDLVRLGVLHYDPSFNPKSRTDFRLQK